MHSYELRITFKQGLLVHTVPVFVWSKNMRLVTEDTKIASIRERESLIGEASSDCTATYSLMYTAEPSCNVVDVPGVLYNLY